jgi:16S rRNA (cytosine1402-N4)-methyltransferase
MHRPVLYNEIIHALRPQRGKFFVDCTVGAGGHAWGILQASSPDGRLLGMDVDPLALSLATEKLAEFGDRAILVKESYTSLKERVNQVGWDGVDGILLDLGVSSMQLDIPEKGFSFQQDAPLDMRFDPDNPIRAADLVNDLPEEELADLIYRYGEDRNARRIAREIVRARPIESTMQLAQVVARAVKGRRRKIHPATLTFQALRIAVNRELESLEKVLPQTISILNPGGRLAVIAFHSLEDRMVKNFLRRESRDCVCPPGQPVCTCDHRAQVSRLHRRPIRPQEKELNQNPRARSARLRVAEKL